MQEENVDIVKIRLDRAKDALATAELNFKNDFLTAANNRLYYAIFYAASALLYKNNFVAKSHTGVKTMLHQHFFKEKILAYRFAEMYNQLFDLRHESDYDDIFFIEKEDIEPYLQQVAEFIYEIEMLVS
jgi:uncharacterized protein (UPF0332 family)